MTESSIIELLTGEDESKHSSSIIRSNSQEIHQYKIFLDEEIGEPKKYRELISCLYSAGVNDSFNFFINSPGGNLSTAMSIIEAIKSTEATVIGIITGECKSAASFIALSCPSVVVSDNAHFLCHTAQYGSTGTTGTIQKHVDFSTKYIHKLLDTIYEGFLTDQELKEIKLGVEFWFDSPQIKKRLESRLKYFEKKFEKKPKKTKNIELIVDHQE